MNVCVPVIEDEGMKSELSGHFGSAPLFLIVDTESGSCRAVPNGDLRHDHGMCQPLRALAGESIDALVVGGIGRGALEKLQAAKVRVFTAAVRTAEEAVSALQGGRLHEVTPATACAHHGGRAHEHGAGGPQGSCSG